MAKVELGVHTGPNDIEIDELRSLWRHCDAAGFDLITLWDHFYESPYVDGTHRASLRTGPRLRCPPPRSSASC